MKQIVSAFVCYVLVTASCLADKVLILAPTVSGGMNSREAQVALGLGYQVDLVDNTVWGNIPATGPNGFSSYRAIILGDPECGSLPSLAAAEANRTTWGPKVNGNVIIVGTDPSYPHPGGPTLTTNAIRFATDQPNKTGLYVSLSCYYNSAAPNTPVPVLEPFGTFKVNTVECWNKAHIVATHPVMNDLTDAILSNWSCSVHEGFGLWPDSGPNKFLVLAIAKGIGTYAAADLSVGTPYILARGQGLAPVTNRFELTPATASNPTNTTHTVCALVVTNGAFAGGIAVTFNVTSGPNAGTTGSATTDANGVACFTYAGNGGVGIDTIVAQYTDSQSQVIIANPVTKTWVDPCGSALSANAMVQCGTNKILVIFNKIVDSTTGNNKVNYTLDHGFTVTDVSPVNNQEVWVTADQNFAAGMTYTLQISNVQDLCGRTLQPNPFTLYLTCDASCPDLQCPSNIVVQCTGPGGTKVHYAVYVNPDCTNVTLSSYPPSDSLFEVGTTTVDCIATTGGGVTNSCSFTVTVTDEIPPTISCPSNLVIYADCSTVAVPFTVTASDNCCSYVSVVCTPPSGSLFTNGTTTSVHCVATDCSGNTNSCDFTVQVILTDAGPPVISYCPTNIVICTTNNCGPMPDATSQVQVADGTETVYISQSIAPGTILCSNTNVTFTVSNLCGGVDSRTARVVVGPCCCNALRTLRLPSALTNITVWESTGTETAYNFQIDPMDPRLLPISGGPTSSNYDFTTAAQEYYDVFLSDADGTPDTNGCCVTIVCNMAQVSANYATGNNIDAVELDFADGLRLGATSVGSVQLGQGLTDPNLLFTSGLANNALGLHDGNDTYLGYGVSSITLCFSTPCPPSLVAHAIAGGFALEWLNTAWPDQWQLQVSTNLVHWRFYDATNLTSPVTITGLPSIQLPVQYYRLFRTN